MLYGDLSSYVVGLNYFFFVYVYLISFCLRGEINVLLFLRVKICGSVKLIVLLASCFLYEGLG